MRPTQTSNNLDVEPEKHSWLEEIASHMDRYPNLRCIAIEEQNEDDINIIDTGPATPWNIPSRLSKSFDDADIALSIRLREARVLVYQTKQT